MYQCSSFSDPFLLSPCASAFPSRPLRPLSPSPPPPPPPLPHNLDHHHTCTHHLFPAPSPPATLPSEASGSFLNAAPPSLCSSYHRSSGDGSIFSLHQHLLDLGNEYYGGGGTNNSRIYDQPSFLDFPHMVQGADMNSQEAAGGGIGAGDPMGGEKVARYSAEERKERIERYRSKRNQRNFQKKITYACRKTLADSRPRVRGRFARNGEVEPETEVEAGEMSCHDGSPSGSFAGDYSDRTTAAPDYGCDPDFWASFVDGLSMNNTTIS